MLIWKISRIFTTPLSVVRQVSRPLNGGHTEECTTPRLGLGFDTPPFLMNQILAFVQSQDVFAWVGALVALLSAVIAVASLIPGDEPEATLTKIVSFLSKFSKK